MESSEEITAKGPQHQPQLWQKDEFEIGGDCEAIPLPQTESIPQQNWTLACGWIPIVGRDIVACLFSRDWEVSVGFFPHHTMGPIVYFFDGRSPSRHILDEIAPLRQLVLVH